MSTYTLGGWSVEEVENPCAKVEALRAQGITSSSSIPLMAAMVRNLEALCAQERANTPFAASVPSGPTLNLRKRPTGTTSQTTTTSDPCSGIKARAQRFPNAATDPQPAIRRILVEKCEAYQRSGVRAGVDPSEATGYPEPSEGMDPKVKIAIGVGAALALGFVGWKVLG